MPFVGVEDPSPRRPGYVGKQYKHSSLHFTLNNHFIENTGTIISSSTQFPKTRRKLDSKFLFTLLICLSILPESSQAIRCYCTDDHCVPAYGVCESAVCLVGLRRPDLTVIRTCGNEPLGCQRNLEHWVDLCACDQPFCNTFSYLRESTQNADSFPPPPPPLASNGQAHARDPQDGTDGFITHGAGGKQHSLIVDEDTRIFQRMDGPPGEIIDEYGNRRQAPLSSRTYLLTMLFVVIPLSVGGFAILIVSFNYYCHLC